MRSPLLSSYSVISRLLSPLAPLWINHRARKGKEDPDRLMERYGHAGLERPHGRLTWCHAASVGESQMLLPIIERINSVYPDMSILVTTGTRTSAELMRSRLPAMAIHQYLPLDYPQAVNRFLDHWQPNMVLWSESEIWPNLIQHIRQRHIPIALINARMSDTSLNRWKNQALESAKHLFGSFDVILAADDHTAKGLSYILNREIIPTGNLKYAALPLPVDKVELKNLKSQLSRRKVWCAASTHPGEDELVIKAHKTLLNRYSTACLILAPRHPERAGDIIRLLEEAGLSYVTRSSSQPITSKTQVFLFDTIGDMGLAYHLSKLTLVCGSLIRGLKGHNPLEPARLNNAVFTGAHISSFADIYMAMIPHNAVNRCLNANIIGEEITRLFRNPKALKELQNQAQIFAKSQDAVLDYVWEQLTPLFEQDTAQIEVSHEAA